MKFNKSRETWRPETGCFHSQPFSGSFTHESIIIINHIIITHPCCLLLPVKANLIGCFYMSWKWHLIYPIWHNCVTFITCFYFLLAVFYYFYPTWVLGQCSSRVLCPTKGPYPEDRNPGWMQPWRTGCGKTFWRRFTWWCCDFSPVLFSLFREVRGLWKEWNGFLLCCIHWF